MFLDEYPELIVPVNQKKNQRIKNPKKTVICFFCKDSLIYPRYDKIFEEIDMYKEYMAVIEPDITVTADMDIEWQNTIMLLNQLFMAVLAVNGIKVILNTRMGVETTIKAFENIPKYVMVASSFLGCDRKYIPDDYTYVTKIMTLLPSRLILYGACNDKLQEKIEDMGICCRKYMSFRILCKKEKLDKEERLTIKSQ